MDLSNFFSLFRTHERMREFYNQLEKLPHRGHPYVISSDNSNQFFAFIGTSHTTDINHPQWAIIQENWRKFIANPNPQKVIFFEGRSSKPITDDESEAITKGADSGYIHWLADRDGIEAVSPEPDRQEEIDELVQSGILEDDLLLYYVGRQLAQWHRYDKIDNPDINAYIDDTLSYINRLKWSTKYDADTFSKIFIAKYGIDPANASRKLLADISDPSVNPVSSACSAVRD